MSLFCNNPWEQHAAHAAASYCCSGGVNAELNATPGDPQQLSLADFSLLSLPSPPPPSPLPPPPPPPPLHPPPLSVVNSSVSFERKK